MQKIPYRISETYVNIYPSTIKTDFYVRTFSK